MGERRPFHLPEDSTLPVTGLMPDIRCVEKDGNKVQVLEAEDNSRSTAARNTESIENI